ncbi:MAG TPA: Asd/ArgC dimerization domain-containing protein [Acidobacteriaceae bacterium]|nr:Asd/ArgC dimerization domain-containing protein [Acidobacteriaceae bacterium]
MATTLRAVIVGASTLLGKELIEELNSSHPEWDLRLADTPEMSGQLVAGGDEALVIQPLTPDIFEGRDIAFFAADPQITRAHWREARSARATVIDLTSTLQDEPGVIVRSPWIQTASAANSSAGVIIPAHPAAVMLGIVASRLSGAFNDVHLTATVLEPASQQGSRGLDELHQQTINLLGFHSLPQEVYDAQVAFNLRVSVGGSAKLDMTQISSTIRSDLNTIIGDALASSISFQLIQAPVFHAYTMSVYAQLPTNPHAAAVRHALHGGLVHLTNPHEEAPTNQSIVEEHGIAVALTEEAATEHDPRGFWLWMAADNLKLAARHAVACAEELAASRTPKPQ